MTRLLMFPIAAAALSMGPACQEVRVAWPRIERQPVAVVTPVRGEVPAVPRRFTATSDGFVEEKYLVDEVCRSEIDYDCLFSEAGICFESRLYCASGSQPDKKRGFTRTGYFHTSRPWAEHDWQIAPTILPEVTFKRVAQLIQLCLGSNLHEVWFVPVGHDVVGLRTRLEHPKETLPPVEAVLFGRTVEFKAPALPTRSIALFHSLPDRAPGACQKESYQAMCDSRCDCFNGPNIYRELKRLRHAAGPGLVVRVHSDTEWWRVLRVLEAASYKLEDKALTDVATYGRAQNRAWAHGCEPLFHNVWLTK